MKRGLLSYDACSIDELRRFVEARSLPLPKQFFQSKADFINALELDDDEGCFPKFTDLPAELRVRIYAMVFGKVQVIRVPRQPPLSQVSRQLRQEVLPIFFSTCTFTFRICVERVNREPKYFIPNGFTAFFEMRDEYVGSVKKLMIQLYNISSPIKDLGKMINDWSLDLGERGT